MGQRGGLWAAFPDRRPARPGAGLRLAAGAAGGTELDGRRPAGGYRVRLSPVLRRRFRPCRLPRPSLAAAPLRLPAPARRPARAGRAGARARSRLVPGARPAIDWSAMGVRLDKWLQVARVFKTRTQSTHACDLGRVRVNGQPAKPHRNLAVGDRVEVEIGDWTRILLVRELRDRPVPKAEAASLFEDQ